MFGAILKATKSSFQKGLTFCRSIYVKKFMKLLAFIFEQTSYIIIIKLHVNGLEVMHGDIDSVTTGQTRERSASVVECLTRDRGAAGSSLTGVTALCP